MDLVISVLFENRDTKGAENWKTLFKKLKFSKVRAEGDWQILLDASKRDAKKIQKLTDGKFRVETVQD